MSADSGSATFEVLGAYGLEIIPVSPPCTWEVDGFHAGEPDRDDELICAFRSS